MSTSSSLDSQTPAIKSLRITYNGAATDEPFIGPASMMETLKKFEDRVVNEFPLRQYLGGSGHSAVFLTERKADAPRDAVIKLVPADTATADAQLARWELASKLSHPHLLRLFEAGRCELDGVALLYVVMERAEEDLSQILPQRPLTPAEAQDMLPPVLDVLVFLHNKGLVHGHVKPTNIMAVADQLKLASDGLYAAGDSNSGVANWRGVDGIREASPYDAPETAGGTTSSAADVWSLGMTLVEALMLRRPTLEQASAGSTAAADPLLPEGVPQPFLEIARRCLRLDPQCRWTVTAMAAWLQWNAGQASAAAAAPEKPVSASRTTGSGLALKAKLPPAKWLYPITIAVAVALVAFGVSRLHGSHPPGQVSQIEDTDGDRPEVPPASADSPVLSQKQVARENSPPAAAAHATPAPPAADRTRKSESHPSATAGPLSSAPQSGSAVAPTMPGRPASQTDSGAVVQRILPDVPQSAADTIHGKIRVTVKVAVDASGDVQEANLESPGPSRYFAGLALEAAHDWKFAPARVDGHSVASQWLLYFVFSRTGVETLPPQPAP